MRRTLAEVLIHGNAEIGSIYHADGDFEEHFDSPNDERAFLSELSTWILVFGKDEKETKRINLRHIAMITWKEQRND